ncbi:MAG: tRNA pseudouridine(38-40) synthase TruA [Deltaproteobacteria bacterium]|nr:tRNA pseudouridine(38-40) synthase TruA [Deltaproteobacteria bacterium]
MGVECVRRDTPGSRNIRLVVEYDGAGFCGWQVQPGATTVQGTLQDALGTVCRHGVVVRGSGRTDSGVHAWGQVANFYTTTDLPPVRFSRAVNGICGPQLRVVAADEVPRDFDSLKSATGKVYSYRLLLRPHASALLAGRVWHLRWPLDLGAMTEELRSLPGEFDWSAFRAADCQNRNPVKQLRRAELSHEERDVVCITFEGSGFLKQMVRILVGTLVDVGRGKLPIGSMASIRGGLDRRAAGQTAPPDGLFLERVLYD